MSTPAPWFRTDWRPIYAELLRRMKELEELARLAGRKLTP